MSGGTTLGRYELITRIGQGGMAEVQLAIQRGPAGFEKLVVVKLIHDHLASQKTFVDMLLDEARVAAMVKHPNVVDIYDLGHADGRYFIAMEYLEGEPLLALLRAGREGRRLDQLSTARLISETADGLEAAHELRSMAGERIELVHHDVSLGNIVVLYTGQVKLVDFGVAKASQSAGQRMQVQGKFSYMAPEKLRGQGGDRRSDIWSLGCVLWEALTLRRLFKGGNDNDTIRQVLEYGIPRPSQINAEVDPAFDHIVMRALERDPARRTSTARELSHDLEEVLHQRRYPRRNDAIARYMQSTFAAHLDARKRLLQQVSSQGAASDDVLVAAFAEEPPPVETPALARTSTPMPVVRPKTLSESQPIARARTTSVNDLSIRIKNSGVMTVVAPPADAEVPASLLEPAPPILARASTAMPRASSNMRAEEPSTNTSAAAELMRSPVTRVDLDQIDDHEDPEVPARAPKKRSLAFVIALGAIAAAAIVFVVVSRRGEHAPSEGAPAQAAAQPSTPPQPPPEAPKSPPVDTARSAPNPAPVVVPELRPVEPGGAKQGGPEGLFQSGMQAYARGDLRGALGAFKKAQQLDPQYAPALRSLGLVYEKLGDRASAKAAYRRYLTVAPTADDAPQIRQRVEAL